MNKESILYVLCLKNKCSSEFLKFNFRGKKVPALVVLPPVTQKTDIKLKSN
jgi:hypothetical protein